MMTRGVFSNRPTRWFEGPSGGGSINICCQSGHWFNDMGPFGLKRIADGRAVPGRPYRRYPPDDCQACKVGEPPVPEMEIDKIKKALRLALSHPDQRKVEDVREVFLWLWE